MPSLLKIKHQPNQKLAKPRKLPKVKGEGLSSAKKCSAKRPRMETPDYSSSTKFSFEDSDYEPLSTVSPSGHALPNAIPTVLMISHISQKKKQTKNHYR